MNPFLILFTDSFGDADTVKRFVDQREEFSAWYRCFPNVYFIVSALDLEGTYQLFADHFGEDRESGRFWLIVPVSFSNVRGELPLDAWLMMRTPNDPEVTPEMKASAALLVALKRNYDTRPSLRKVGPGKIEFTLKAPNGKVVTRAVISRSALERIRHKFPAAFEETLPDAKTE